jgi:hypothetical protein
MKGEIMKLEVEQNMDYFVDQTIDSRIYAEQEDLSITHQDIEMLFVKT